MILVVDNFCEHAKGVRQSALDSGFGRWSPNQGEVGSSIYDGMNWKVAHGVMLRALAAVMGRPVFPNTCFCRITTPSMERAYIHSDREDGDFTCVAYLSQHDDVSGTAFYKHRATGLLEMPPLGDVRDIPQLAEDMVSGGEAEWEQTDFVRGFFNRAVIFSAPMFHSRIPLLGIGEDTKPETARMVWVSHFSI